MGSMKGSRKIGELMPSVQEDLVAVEQFKEELQQPSKILSNNYSTFMPKSSVTSSYTTDVPGRCAKCQVWKRINAECRNFGKRFDFTDNT